MAYGSTPYKLALALMIFVNSEMEPYEIIKHIALGESEFFILSDILTLMENFSFLSMKTFFSLCEVKILFSDYILHGGFEFLQRSLVFSRHPNAYMEAISLIYFRNFAKDHQRNLDNF